MEVSLVNGGLALVDDSDADLVLGHRWFGVRRGRTRYAATKINGTPIEMHRMLLGKMPGKVIDHQSGDGLDNRRKNLRFCSHAENMRNRRKSSAATTSKFKGVWIDSRYGKWIAEVRQGGGRWRVGPFDNEIDAARAYDRAARVFHGRFAKTNVALGLLAPE